MAARRMVSSLKNVLLHPLKSPNNNIAVHRPLLNPNPSLGSRFPSAKARPFSTKPESGHRRQWETEYRRRLGIGDSRVIYHPPSSPIRPPKKMDEIKIHFGSCPEEDGDDGDVNGGHGADTNNGGNKNGKTGGICGVARNASGKVMGLTAGHVKYSGDELELQLYALKASANLAEELQNTGMHIGPVVYQTCLAPVVSIFHVGCEGTVTEDDLRRNMPRDEDLEQVGPSCIVLCGFRDRLREICPHLRDDFLDRLESDIIPLRWNTSVLF